MSRRHTLLTVALAAVVSFLVGAILAGGVARSSVAAGPTTKTAGTHAAPRLAGASQPALPNFADVVEHINGAVVNIDATSKVGERGSLSHRDGAAGPAQLDGPFGRGTLRRDSDAPRRGSGSGFIIDADGS